MNKKPFFILLLLACLASPLGAQELKLTVKETVKLSYKKFIVNLNKAMIRSWNKSPTYFSDGITYSVDVRKNEAIFKVRKFNMDITNLNPFMLIKISRATKDDSQLTIWEGEFSQDVNLNLSKQVKDFLKGEVKSPCKLSKDASVF